MKPTFAIACCLLASTFCVGQQQTVSQGAVEQMQKALEGTSSTYFALLFNNTKDFEAKSAEELLSKVDQLKDFLNRLKDNENGLREATDGKVRAAVDQVETWLNEIDEFQSKARYDAGRNTEYLKIEWENKSKRIYDQGLSELIHLAKMTAGAQTTSLSCLLVFTLAILLCTDVWSFVL